MEAKSICQIVCPDSSLMQSYERFPDKKST